MSKMIDELIVLDKKELVNRIINNRVADVADFGDNDKDPRGHGKRIPYVGWYWRPTNFVEPCISIGDCGGFIGVMENNKWGYPERFMTLEEATEFIRRIEKAFDERDKGGCLADTEAAFEKEMVTLWNWFQTLKIEKRDER